MTARIIAGGSPLRVRVGEQSDVGECRRSARRLAEGHGFDEEGVGRICIVATELATNVVRHGAGGELLMQVLDDGVRPVLEMLAIDRGRGMADVEKCLQDGYSTGGTAGTGLGAVLRLSTLFDVFSTPGRGTVVLSRIARKVDPFAPPPRASSLEYGAVCVAIAGETECGDTWRIADGGDDVGVLVVDGLGHGALAAGAARAAAQVFGERPFEEPSMAMQHLHRALSGGRGAVAACAQWHVAEARVEYAGVGNIYGTLIAAARSQGMVSNNGTLGAHVSRTGQFRYAWPAGGLLVMHSDGLSARWNLADHPGLSARHAAVIAALLYRDFARSRDDATVVVVRRRP